MKKRESAGVHKSIVDRPEADLETVPVAPPLAQSTALRTTRRDQLAYLADMIDELGSMAHRIGCPVLAGILDLAKREALLEKARS